MQGVNGEEKPMWPMPDKGAHLIAFPVAKKDIMPGTAPDNKEKGERERKLISSTLTQKKTWCTKGAKRNTAE
jgi:hypothetical protein